MIGSYSPYFVEELQRRVISDRLEKAIDLARGAAPDYPAYQHACGILEGMELVLDIANEIKKDIDKG